MEKNTYFSESRDVEVLFEHPQMGSLPLTIKPDSVVWSYELKTANYPTYGGEVVQILSCNIGDISISGTTRNYRTLESIYEWFVEYLQIATQDGYDARPVTFTYIERNWVFDIFPKQVPGFRYGRDVIAPTWTVVGEVVETDELYRRTLLDDLTRKFMEEEGVEFFGKATAEIGYDPVDPFRTPVADNNFEKDKNSRSLTSGDLADYFLELIPAWSSGNFDALSADYSRPAFLSNRIEPVNDDAVSEAVKKGKNR